MRPQIMQIETARLTHPAPEPPAMDAAPVADGVEAGQTAAPLTIEQMQALQKQIVATLCTCFDPEVPVNIYELGLIYNVEMATDGSVAVRMTLTSPACPVAGSLPGEVQRKVQAVPGVATAKVELVWEPPWDKNRMSEAAKLQLGIED
jgi:FeS assembly SUF system protein